MIRCIAAIDDKYGLAKAGKIPWKLPSDIAYYNAKIRHTTVLMGWGTFVSMGQKPVPTSRTIVVTHNVINNPNVETIDDIPAYIAALDTDLWVIGGGQIFAQTLEAADELYLTRVEGDFDCDVLFPPFEHLFRRVQVGKPQQENGITFRFEIWRRTSAK